MSEKRPTLTIPSLSDLELQMLAIIAEQKRAPKFEQLERMVKAIPGFQDITREEYKAASSHLFRQCYIVKGKQLSDTKNIRNKSGKIVKQDNIVVGGEAWITTKGLAALDLPRIHKEFVMRGLLEAGTDGSNTYELTEPGKELLHLDPQLHALAKHFGDHTTKALAGEGQAHSGTPLSPGI